MKQFVLLVSIVCIMGCSNVANDSEASTINIAETVEESAATSVVEDFPYATITQQKLQEYIDLQLLKRKHPNLASSFDVQIRELMKGSLTIPNEQDSIKVDNVRPLTSLTRVNDTLQQLHFSYTLSSETIVTTDTLTANIITKSHNIDGTKVVLTNIQFSNH